MTIQSREIRLKRYPSGLPTQDDFEFATVDLGEIQEGEILVKNTWMSVDPYMRGRMFNVKSYVPPFQVGQVLEGGAVGRILESKNPDFKVGDLVDGMNGWREAFISKGIGLTKIPTDAIPAEEFLGAAGLTGFTAYIGLLHIAELKEGDTVFVSAASGAVGSIACQIAKLKNCTVVGSVGSNEKAQWVSDELGVDHVINYKEVQNLNAALTEACPNGFDVYFENVGGDHLEAALNSMKDFGRIAVCGMIDRYNDKELRPGPGNLAQIIVKRLKLRGFIAYDHLTEIPTFLDEMIGWIQDKKIKTRNTVVEGIEKAPEAFLGLFQGKNIGKMLVKLE